MKDLLEKSNINKNKLKMFIVKIVAQEIMNLSEPCYYPSLKKYSYEMFNYVGLHEQDIKIYFHEFYKNTEAATAELKKDVVSNLLIFIMYYFLTIDDIQAFKNTMTYYMIRQYTNLMNKQINFCKPDVFKYALDNLNKIHLFVREGTISSAIVHLSNEMVRRYMDGITSADPFSIHFFIFESRTRLSQSIKSFAELYYKFQKEGVGFKSTEQIGKDNQEYTLTILEKGKRITNDITNHICIYKNINQIAINDAKKITRINESLANNIAKDLVNIQYIDDIKLIIELFLKDLTSIDQICGPGFLQYVKNLMSIKRTSKIIYFKQEVIDLTEKVIDNIDYREKYDSLTKQTRFLIACFIAYYLAIVTRHLVCGTKILRLGSFRIL